MLEYENTNNIKTYMCICIFEYKDHIQLYPSEL